MTKHKFNCDDKPGQWQYYLQLTTTGIMFDLQHVEVILVVGTLCDEGLSD